MLPRWNGATNWPDYVTRGWKVSVGTWLWSFWCVDQRQLFTIVTSIYILGLEYPR